jgi:hypothetical protein
VSIKTLVPAGGGTLNTDSIDWLAIQENVGDGQYFLNAHLYGAGLSSYTNLGTYASFANLTTALNSFLAVVAFPWLAVGSPAGIEDSDYPTSEWPVAVNLALVQGAQDGGTGVEFLTIYAGDDQWSNPTFGYGPFTDFAGFQTVLSAFRGGTYTFAND